MCAIPHLSRLLVLELLSMLFQDDAHQLTACPHASLGEELLQCCFDRTLRHPDSCRNLFVGKSFEHAGEHLPLTLGEWLCSIVLRGSYLGFEDFIQVLLLQPYLASHHVADCLRQQCGGIVFSKNSGDSRADQLRSHLWFHTRGHDQRFSVESLFLCQPEKLPAVTLPQIEIKEYDIDLIAFQNLETFSNCPAMGYLESRLRSEQSPRTLSKQRVII